MLDLILTILKYLSVFVGVRLLGSAFGFEFGISRQYLRLLEFVFYFGERRIKRVESRSKGGLTGPDQSWSDYSELNHHDQYPPSNPNELIDTNDDLSGNQNATQELSDSNGIAGHASNSNGLNLEEDTKTDATRGSAVTTTRPRKLELIIEDTCDGNSIIGGSTPPATPKIKRISTPDGPPVFLLDDSDLEDRADETDMFDDCDKNSNRITENYDKFIHRQTRKGFHLDDVSKFVQKGIAAIVDDEVTKRFSKEELKSWNLLTRTDAKNYQTMSKSLGLAWAVGVVFRYTFLFPIRLLFTLFGYIWLLNAILANCLLPEIFNIKDNCYYLISTMAFTTLSCGLTSRLIFHNSQYKPQKGDICVANHTSPMDVVVLSCDNCYAIVGQQHGGFLGLLEDLISKGLNHIWFDRHVTQSRLEVMERLKNHVKHRDQWPILIFPEGTCINNSAVMLFRKGTFELSDRICPIAMKYDHRFGDVFWDSSKYSYFQYTLMLMSSWAIKCDVWYMPPMDRLPGECGAEFARRVKSEIARRAGLKDLNWDGELKRKFVKERWKEQQQEDFAKRLNLG